MALGAQNENACLSETDLLVWKNGGRQIDSRERFGRAGNAILLVQDELIDRLFPGEITDIPGFVKYSSRLKDALAPHICSLLSKGISVVLDFPGNTKTQRAWFRQLFENANAEHELHFVDAPDALCKRQLKDRSKDLPPGSAWTTDADFEAITVYFQPPSEEEGFNVVHHKRA